MRSFSVDPKVRARDKPRGAIVTSGARAGHGEPEEIVAAYLMRGDGRVVDMADGIVPVEESRARVMPNFEDRGVDELGLLGLCSCLSPSSVGLLLSLRISSSLFMIAFMMVIAQYLGKTGMFITPFQNFIQYLTKVEREKAATFWRQELSESELSQFRTLPSSRYEPVSNKKMQR